MVFVAALIAIEKMLPWKAVANRGIAVLLLVLGVSVALWPERVPGLTLPNSAEARQAMMRMHGGSMPGAPMQHHSPKGTSMPEGKPMKHKPMEDGAP